MASNKNIAIGIDLGTCYSCVACFNDKKVDIIENISTGLRTTPSIVTFNNDDRIIGKPPKVTENTVFEAKRLIGRKFDDPTVQSDIKKWPFTIVNENSFPKIKVQYRGNEEIFSPEQISAMILARLKECAVVRLGQDITKAVITVPAYFSDSQRQATKDAAEIAGLEVLRIINEPTAAAIAYGYNKKIHEKKNILIYDLGGGTFDVSIMEIDYGKFTTIATGGDTHLGGVDFDNRIVDHFVHNFNLFNGKDISTDKRAIQRLKEQCELAKRALSEAYETSIEVPAFCDGEDLSETLTRALFEKLNYDLFNKTIDIVGNILEDAKMDKSQISDIVLVGGSIKIPKIQSLLKEFFDGKPIKQDINPDEAVAYGAAIQAAILNDEKNTEIGLQVIDVTPLSLGIALKDDRMNNIINRNTRIPTSNTQNYSTVVDDQETIRIKVFQGERKQASENNLLGEFILDNIKKAKASEPRIEVTFEVDHDGILYVTAKDKDTLSTNNISIKNTKGNLSRDQIEKMIADANTYDAEDRAYFEKVKVKNTLSEVCYKTKSLLESASLDIFKKKKIEDKIDYTLAWITGFRELSLEEISEKVDEINNIEFK